MVDGSLRSTAFHVFTAAKMEEMNWFETVMTALKKDQLDKNDKKKNWISWSAYHARIQEAIIPPAAISHLLLLPLFLVVRYLKFLFLQSINHYLPLLSNKSMYDKSF